MSKLTSKKFSSMKIFQLTSLSLALALVGCNGPVDSIDPEPDLGVTENSGTGNTNNGSGTNKNAQLKISNIKLTDALTDKITSSVTTDGAKATVIVTDKAGKPVENAIVTFSGEGVTFNSANGAVLTNMKGEASVFLSPMSSNDTSAYSMTAKADYKGLTATANPVNYSLQALNVMLDELMVAEDNLESGASTLVSLVTKNESTKKYKNNIKVGFSTTCGSFSVTDVTSSSQGNVKNTYTAIDENGELCEGEQSITVTTSGGVSKVAKVSIKKVEASSIIYTSLDPVILGLKGSGDSGSKKIEFTVFANGRPASNQEVELELTKKSPIDFSFVSLGNRAKRILKSDASGKVSVLLYPGNIPGPVEVTASLVKDKTIFASSRNVSVAKGRPLQKALTIAVDRSVALKSKVEDIGISAFVRDRQGNPVPEGTVVNFVAEGGVITPQCSTDNMGRCSVTFTTQRPHPRDGRVTILAYTEGEKLYIDKDGNNAFTKGEQFKNNIGDFFRDDNESGKYEEGEFIYHRPIMGNKIACGISSFDEPNIPDSCDDTLDTTVRKQIVMGLSNDIAVFKILNKKANTGYLNFRVYGNDSETLTLPSGSSVRVSALDRSDNNQTCNTEIESGYKQLPTVIQLSNINDYVEYDVELLRCVAGDKILLEVTIPGLTKQVKSVVLE